jgi:hypothetical protein
MRWNFAAAALSASAGFIAVIVDGVDLSAEALVFYRLTLAALTVLLAAALFRRLDVLRAPEMRGRLAFLGAILGAHWLLFFATIKLSSVAVAVLTTFPGRSCWRPSHPCSFPSAGAGWSCWPSSRRESVSGSSLWPGREALTPVRSQSPPASARPSPTREP